MAEACNGWPGLHAVPALSEMDGGLLEMKLKKIIAFKFKTVLSPKMTSFELTMSDDVSKSPLSLCIAGTHEEVNIEIGESGEAMAEVNNGWHGFHSIKIGVDGKLEMWLSVLEDETPIADADKVKESPV